MDYYGWRPYVSVAERRRKASAKWRSCRKKGHPVSPVVIEGRTIAKTFWGKAWCENLERYSDYANRLPRGRTYVRNGSVVDLQIAPGDDQGAGQRLGALQGDGEDRRRSRRRAGSRFATDCAGGDRFAGRASAGALLEGRDGADLPAERRACFRRRAEIKLSCSCPDWARRCASTWRRCCTASARGSTISRNCSSVCAKWTRRN